MSVGGKRENAGRPANSGKYGEKTKATRLPETIVDSIEQLDSEGLKEFGSYLHDFFAPVATVPQGASFVVARQRLSKNHLTRKYSSTVAATVGVTSTLTPNASSALVDLHHLLVKKPGETFVVPVAGDSMNQAGIQDGDLLVVQKITDEWSQLTPDTIVVAFVDGNETVKRFKKLGRRSFLVPESDNDQHQELEMTKEIDVQIIGVVLYAIHPTHRSSRF
jgi:DNA polymerase V